MTSQVQLRLISCRACVDLCRIEIKSFAKVWIEALQRRGSKARLHAPPFLMLLRQLEASASLRFTLSRLGHARRGSWFVVGVKRETSLRFRNAATSHSSVTVKSWSPDVAGLLWNRYHAAGQTFWQSLPCVQDLFDSTVECCMSLAPWWEVKHALTKVSNYGLTWASAASVSASGFAGASASPSGGPLSSGAWKSQPISWGSPPETFWERPSTLQLLPPWGPSTRITCELLSWMTTCQLWLASWLPA